MMKPALRGVVVGVVAAACLLSIAVVPDALAFRVLVTNDDGVESEGIAVLVARLAEQRSLDIEVLAPATNQSGTGDNFTTDPIEVFSTRTSGGFPARAVRGFPADTVLFGLLSGTSPRPDLVISGINQGQNVAEAVEISGTVGAALTAARLGVPAFAVSQGLAPSIRYDEAADYVARLVTRYRSSATFRRLMQTGRVDGRARVLNINFPTCTTGSLRGVRTVLLGQTTRIVGYEPTPGIDTWAPDVVRTPPGSNDCTSRLERPRTDLEAMNNGFASVTMLNPDLANAEGTSAVRRYVEN